VNTKAFAALLNSFLTVWIDERINPVESLLGKVSVNEENLSRVSQAFFLGKLEVNKLLHQSDGADEHKIAWLLVCGIIHYGDELLHFDESIPTLKHKYLYIDCALTAFCSFLSINQFQIESDEPELYKSLKNLVSQSNKKDFFIGSLVGYLLQKTHPLNNS
jgi:hypothetical protein